MTWKENRVVWIDYDYMHMPSGLLFRVHIQAKAGSLQRRRPESFGMFNCTIVHTGRLKTPNLAVNL